MAKYIQENGKNENSESVFNGCWDTDMKKKYNKNFKRIYYD